MLHLSASVVDSYAALVPGRSDEPFVCRNAQAAAATAGEARLQSIPVTVQSLSSYVGETYAGSYDEVHARLSADDKGDAVRALVMRAESYVLSAIDALSDIERWISLGEPTLEDGNNFGVDVQRHVRALRPPARRCRPAKLSRSRVVSLGFVCAAQSGALRGAAGR